MFALSWKTTNLLEGHAQVGDFGLLLDLLADLALQLLLPHLWVRETCKLALRKTKKKKQKKITLALRVYEPRGSVGGHASVLRVG
jgi:hypothetical protein